MIRVPPDGPVPARIMLVGEAPGETEEEKLVPFVGASGSELNRILHEAGIMRSECYVTNVVPFRPPNNDLSVWLYTKKKDIPKDFHQYRDRYVHSNVIEGVKALSAQISEVNPNVIVAFGNTALWALTGKWGINKWRGSMLFTDPLACPQVPGGSPSGALIGRKVIPAIHPAGVLREWSYRATLKHDLQRAKRFISGDSYPQPAWRFRIRPSFQTVMRTLDEIEYLFSIGPVRISFDLETRAGHIACAGLSWSLLDAICIPFMVSGKGDYWGEEEEVQIIYRLSQILRHPNAQVIGQNALYDCQYTWRHWHFVPRIYQDTMISQHSIFSDQPKNLGYLASLYCNYYVYWKDEGKNWDPKMGEEQLWYYNCQDCVYTDEVGRTLEYVADASGRRQVYDSQQEMFWPVLKAMIVGVKIDQKKRSDLTLEVHDDLAARESFLTDLIGHPINPRSPQQMQKLLYEDLKLPKQFTRAKKGVPARLTTDDEALQKLARLEPLVRPIIHGIADCRTLQQFLSNFLMKPLDRDGRMRCAFNIGGSESGKSAPKTYRLSSSENAFGSGGNLQNIPSEKSKSLGKAAARAALSSIGNPVSFPNIRSMFVPDQGYIWFDGDLDRADLQVVAAEIQDARLLSALHLGTDIHLLNAFILSGREPPPLEELVEGHPRYLDHRAPLKLAREFAKVFCHGTNYGGSARTMAAHTGRTVHECDRAQKIWFGAHPGLKTWHTTIETQIKKHHFVENKFGYRWHIFDRVDGLLPEAIAWIPQSTVSVLINKIWQKLFNNFPEIDILLQVHDSLCGQLKDESLIPQMTAAARIEIPYETPLTIPFSIKTSRVSWGDVR